MQRRRIINHGSMSVSLASLLVVLAFWYLDKGNTSPGEIALAHARHPNLGGSGSCEVCHAGGSGDMVGSCLACHEEIEVQLAAQGGLHGLISGDLSQNCPKCHSEHHGNEFRMINRRSFALAGIADPEHFDHAGLDFDLGGGSTFRSPARDAIASPTPTSCRTVRSVSWGSIKNAQPVTKTSITRRSGKRVTHVTDKSYPFEPSPDLPIRPRFRSTERTGGQHAATATGRGQAGPWTRSTQSESVVKTRRSRCEVALSVTLPHTTNARSSPRRGRRTARRHMFANHVTGQQTEPLSAPGTRCRPRCTQQSDSHSRALTRRSRVKPATWVLASPRERRTVFGEPIPAAAPRIARPVTAIRTEDNSNKVRSAGRTAWHATGTMRFTPPRSPSNSTTEPVSRSRAPTRRSGATTATSSRQDGPRREGRGPT